MRIISNFKDYYDIGMTYGQDPALVYLRKTEEVPGEDRLRKVIGMSPYYISYPGRPYGIELDIHFIGFCGKLYPFVGYRNAVNIRGNLSDFIIGQNDIFERELIEKSLDKPPNKWVEFGSEFTLNSYGKWARHVLSLDVTDFSISIQAPIFKVSRYAGEKIVFEKNPRLKEIGFQSVKPPVIAFQELSMFLGSALVSEKEVPVKVSDTVLRDKHGFDEWSFRRKK
jgi:hypothetical protein